MGDLRNFGPANGLKKSAQPRIRYSKTIRACDHVGMPIKMNLGWRVYEIKNLKFRLIRWLDRFYLECLQNIEPELIFFFKQIKLAHPSFGLSNSLYWISVFRILRNRFKKGQLDKKRSKIENFGKNREFSNQIVALFEIFESNSPFLPEFHRKTSNFWPVQSS